MTVCMFIALLPSLVARRLAMHQTQCRPNIKLVDLFKLLGTGLSLVCCLVIGGGGGGGGGGG